MTAQPSVAKLVVEPEEKRIGISLTQLAMRRLRRDRLTLVALTIVTLMALMSFSAPFISNILNISYTQTDASRTFLPVGAEGHPLGTDDLGRDHLARLLYGGQVSLSVGFLAATVAISIGVTLGIITGFYGGLIDDFTNWVIATLNSIPSLFLLLIVAAVLQPSPTTLIPCSGSSAGRRQRGWCAAKRCRSGTRIHRQRARHRRIAAAHHVRAHPAELILDHRDFAGN
ncbi:MAG: hypothetical protein IPO91_23385 [Chloroflexi bacterium]|nr:hypothetical protein [Chloroflexota bacterium]